MAGSKDNGSLFVKNELLDLVKEIEKDKNMVGDPESSKLRLPYESDDGRVLTWTKLAKTISAKVQNDPTCRDDCWFVKSNNASGGSKRSEGSSGYVHAIKLTGKGEKWQTHRILHVLRNPGDWVQIGDKTNSNTKLHVAHRCGHGRATTNGGLCCINPFHTVLVDEKINQDHKGCKYGRAKLCPHDPKCVFTWMDTGKVKECFNDPRSYPPESCPHERRCGHDDKAKIIVVELSDEEDDDEGSNQE